MSSSFIIAYLSPNGSTRTVAATLANHLTGAGAGVTAGDLSRPEDRRRLAQAIDASPPDCLLVGSPVYRDMAVTPVMAFIDSLPRTQHTWSAPFVTYGRACSGVALWQMAAALQARGYGVAAAAKVAAVHSMMWQTERPAGEGHPDEADLLLVRRLADTLLTAIASGAPRPLALEALDYQPAALAEEFKAKLTQPKMIIPKQVDETACTACGTCVDVCPTAAVRIDPLPVFSDDCIDCFNCIRRCPEAAIAPGFPMEKIVGMIRERVRTIDEHPLTAVFTAPETS